MKTVLLFILYLKSGLIGAVYKQWIPDTNFDNATNWDKARVPCFKDKIYFDSRMSVSVYVQSTHLLTEMHIPLDGEFIFVPDSGFAASTGSDDPNCHKGENLNFISPDQNAWYDPKMWHAAASIDDLEKNKYLFTVDEERVPCQYDNVIFRPETSFRVNVDSAEKEISVSTISVLGKKFSSNDDFSQYMQSNTAKLQFHGKGTIKVTNTKCSDKSGCECGNTANFDRICSALNQHTGNKCPKVSCKNPLTPVGHCCGVCGATISLKYSSEFDLERYRDRLIHTFLSLGKYAGVQMGISKVSRQQTLLGFIPRETVSEVQIVLIDEKTGSQAGITAAQLAKDIMNDIQEHGSSFGIEDGDLHLATGSDSEAHKSPDAGVIVGAVIGAFAILLLVAAIFAFARGNLRIPTFNVTLFQNHINDQDSLGGPIDKGFDNPMFDTPKNLTLDPNALYTGDEALKGFAMTASGAYYLNPAYDETDFTA